MQTEERRDEIAQAVAEARKDYASEDVKRGTVDEMLRGIEESIPLDLKTLLKSVRRASRKLDKGKLSHQLAKGFMELLEREGIRLLETGTGNANYFCAEIDGMPLAVSPFGSHVEWWEKISDSFKSMVGARGCRWGVVLFLLPESKGIWIEGLDYEDKVLKERRKVNASYVRKAVTDGFAHPFYSIGEFVILIKEGPPSRPRSILVRRKT